MMMTMRRRVNHRHDDVMDRRVGGTEMRMGKMTRVPSILLSLPFVVVTVPFLPVLRFSFTINTPTHELTTKSLLTYPVLHSLRHPLQPTYRHPSHTHSNLPIPSLPPPSSTPSPQATVPLATGTAALP